MRKKALIRQILLYLGLLPLLSFNVHAPKLYLLSNHENTGDHNQALGILAALKKLTDHNLSFKDLNTKIISPLKIKEEIEKDLPGEKVIVIGAGEGGIDGIMDLSANPNLIICLTSHMFLERYRDPNLLEKVKFIALPTHAIAQVKEQLGTKLIETTGVAHNRYPEEADKVYEKWGNTELPPCKTYLGIVLGGDAPAPGPANEIKLFTECDAAKLADYISQNAKEACILVLNGPRTGKHDLNKNEILTVHRKGELDHMTKLFKQKLAAKGIKNVKVFDFQHNTPENKSWTAPYNSFDLVIGALRATNGEIMVPGDSTSVISESIDTLPPGKVLVYEDSAMNEVHKAHLVSELRAGRISVLENYHNIRTPTSNSDKPQPNAATIIAQKLWQERVQNGG